MTAYYNEIDPFAAQWLRNLISAGLIAPGEVDERSIEDVRPDDLRGFKQCHFFAGIGGWSYALRLAGWPDDEHVWTGSCPCQGFSVAGLQRGFSDPRHLWPTWFNLVRECKPSIVFGEQVAAAIRLGWLDLVQTGMEDEDYTFGKAVLGAHGVRAPHIRQRLWFVADSRSKGQREVTGSSPAYEVENGGARWIEIQPDGDNEPCGHGSNSMADTARQQHHGCGNAGQAGRDESPNSGLSCTLEYAERATEPRFGRIGLSLESKQEARRPGYANPWQECELIQCSDGKSRPTQPGLQPLAYGVSGRLGRLRSYGNAIVPQVAAEFISAYMEATAI